MTIPTSSRAASRATAVWPAILPTQQERVVQSSNEHKSRGSKSVRPYLRFIQEYQCIRENCLIVMTIGDWCALFNYCHHSPPFVQPVIHHCCLIEALVPQLVDGMMKIRSTIVSN